MTVTFTLNGKRVSANVPANKRLIDILAEDLAMELCRPGCYRGECGACVVVLDQELAHACLVPAFAAQDTDILTYEGIAGQDDDIVEGFKLSGIEPCRDCIQSRTLTIHALLAAHPLPRRVDIARALGWHRCGCTDTESLFRAVETIVTVRRYNRHAGG